MTTRTTCLLALVLLALLWPGVVDAVPGVPPDVAEIDYFVYDECANEFLWQASTEIIIWRYQIEHPASGWTSEHVLAYNYGSNLPASYEIAGPPHADLAGDYRLRVYFDTGVTVSEDVAMRGCGWVPALMASDLSR